MTVKTGEPTEAQKKEFWEWCGCREVQDLSGMRGAYKETDIAPFPMVFCWRYPDKTKHPCLPPIDLNNLFKYAVPKAIKKLESRFDSMTNKARGLEILFAKWLENIKKEMDDADALFWAIYKVIVSKKVL